MLKYESLMSLFEFLVVPKNNKTHYNDSSRWTMAKFMHQVVMRATKVIGQVAYYVALSYDKVSTVNNQEWLSIHYYVVQNWVRIPILISLERVVVGLRNDNLIKVIMEALMIGGGLPQN